MADHPGPQPGGQPAHAHHHRRGEAHAARPRFLGQHDRRRERRPDHQADQDDRHHLRPAGQRQHQPVANYRQHEAQDDHPQAAEAIRQRAAKEAADTDRDHQDGQPRAGHRQRLPRAAQPFGQIGHQRQLEIAARAGDGDHGQQRGHSARVGPVRVVDLGRAAAVGDRSEAPQAASQEPGRHQRQGDDHRRGRQSDHPQRQTDQRRAERRAQMAADREERHGPAAVARLGQ